MPLKKLKKKLLNNSGSFQPTKIYTKKCANLALNLLFLCSLVLILLTKLVPNRNIKRCSFNINYLNYDTKLAPNKMQIYSK